MTHELSLACYRHARESDLPRERYRHLEELIRLFGGARTATPTFDLPGRAPNLLIVEDEEELVALIRNGLVNSGYPADAISSFATSEEALLFARANPVGIAIIDIRLMSRSDLKGHYTSGIEVLKVIHETSPGAAVLLASAYGTASMVNRAVFEYGAAYYLGKPYTVDDILRFVHWGLGQVLGRGAVEPLEDNPPPTGDRILVVDDDPAICESLTAALVRFGYDADWVTSAREAFDRIGRDRYDAMLLDLKMPEMDGLEFLRRTKDLRNRPLVFVLTAIGDDGIAQEAARLGAHEFFVKPCDLPLLRLTLEYALARQK